MIETILSLLAAVILIAWFMWRRTRKPLVEPLTDEENAQLEKDLRDMGGLDPKTAELLTEAANRYYPLEDGARFDKKTGAIIYKDSESIVPYIGSEQEAIDAEKGTHFPQRLPRNLAGKKTHEACLGWGCKACGWIGSV